MVLPLPKKYIYKKIHKGKIKNKIYNYKTFLFRYGFYGIKAIENGRITYKQIEATRKIISKRIKRIGKIWIRVYPLYPITSKTLGIRMGRGVGAINYWISRIFSGTILFEISDVNFFLAKNTLTAAKKKLPIKTIVILNPFFYIKYFQPKK